MSRFGTSGSGGIGIVPIMVAVFLIVIFMAASYGLAQNLGQYLPLWALVLIVAVLGISLVMAGKRTAM